MREVFKSFFIVILLGEFTVASAQLPPEIKAEGTCDGLPVGSSCWMELTSHPECYVWNADLKDGETAIWSGKCSGLFPEGEGTLTRSYIGKDGSGNAVEKRPPAGTGSFKKGKMYGLWVFRWSNRSLWEEGYYVEGIRNGDWTEYYSNGDSQGSYVNGKKNGVWITFYKSGYSKQVAYKEDKKHGLSTHYYPDKTVRIQYTYVEGKRHGEYVSFHEDGTAWRKGRYENDKKQGLWIYCYESGDTSKGSYIDGGRVGTWFWYDEGEDKCWSLKYDDQGQIKDRKEEKREMCH